MSDLSTYLSSEVGIAISNEIIAHILWGDDLILFSDTPWGLQKQLNGLLKFCSNKKIIVNEIKTKSMCFGTNENLNVSFNGKPIQQVSQYKYLGVIVRFINKVGQDLCPNNYRYISDKSGRAVFSMKRKLKFIRSLPPHSGKAYEGTCRIPRQNGDGRGRRLGKKKDSHSACRGLYMKCLIWEDTWGH